MYGAADDTTEIEKDLAEYGYWASLDSSDTFKLSAHSSQTVKLSNIQTVSELELILRMAGNGNEHRRKHSSDCSPR